jgi:hypothetical protein
VAAFDIRAWMRRHDVTLPVDDPDVRSEIAKLLRGDLTPERLAAYAERLQPNQDRTAPRNGDDGQRADAVSA